MTIKYIAYDTSEVDFVVNYHNDKIDSPGNLILISSSLEEPFLSEYASSQYMAVCFVICEDLPDEKYRDFWIIKDGKITVDDEGYDKIKSQEEIEWRNNELNWVDFEINKIEDIGGDSLSWRTYRVTLRDYPKQDDFPNGSRPCPPSSL